MNGIPERLWKLFWDVDPEKIDLQTNRFYVLQRILECGDLDAVQWMWSRFKKSEIGEALCRFRGYSRKSANFWATVLEVPKEKVLCLRKSSLAKPKNIWPY
ncbi:MAG: hypothetical protein A3G87_07030 [Omnitrophica bacterium RIFCSPLOWO2_12_FULL_50_11]|nr:MAG: hypothetical protein A3G87_07030 [Omnitrophica bacterium RIFCSPLOWO2_12_FULL_50_11]